MEHAQRGGWHSPCEQDGEDFQPRYVLAPRLVGHLACGELTIEPVLGPVRVVNVKAGEDEHGEAGETDSTGAEGHVLVCWRDEHGPGMAQGRYPAERSFDVRMPARSDRLRIRQGIDQARWHNSREITDNIARLIAAHLHSGKQSALHRLMIDGRTDEVLYDELDKVRADRPYAKDWVDALAWYCLRREDAGPIAAWTRRAAAEGEVKAEEWLTNAGVSVPDLVRQTDGNRRERHPWLLAKKHVKSDLAADLIEAAFALGLEAGWTGRVARAPWRSRDDRHNRDRVAT